MFAYGLFGWKGDEAIAKFTEALSHMDRYTDARFARGRTYDEMRKWAAALDDFTRVVAEQSERAEGLYHRGLALWNLKRPADALTDPPHEAGTRSISALSSTAPIQAWT